jgi:hypothetical protein
MTQHSQVGQFAAQDQLTAAIRKKIVPAAFRSLPTDGCQLPTL